MKSLRRRCVSGALALGLTTTSLAGSLLTAMAAQARELRSAELQVRREGTSVSLVVTGVGADARLEQQKQGAFGWEARVKSPEASG